MAATEAIGVNMKKSEKIIVGVLAVLAPLAGYHFFLSGSDASQSQPQRLQQNQEVAPTPRAATLKEYSEVTNEVAPELSEREATLEDLEFRLRQADLSARIAQAENMEKSAKIETQRSEAEVSRILSEISRADRRAELERLRAEREMERMRSQDARDAELSQNNLEESPGQVEFRPELVEVVSQTQHTSSKDGPEYETSLLRVRDSKATLSVRGQVGEVPVGYPFKGVRVISIDANTNTAVVEGRRSGNKVELIVATRTSRQFSNVRPISPEAEERDGEGQSLDEGSGGPVPLSGN